MMRYVLGFLWLLAAGPSLAQELSITPAAPTPLDTVRLRWTHVGCTDPGSVQVSQQANAITASANRIFRIDCGTVLGYFDEYALGRFPSGEYDARLIVNPPPGTLGPSQLLGPIHFSVSALPPVTVAAPHDDYTDLWWSPQRSGEALLVKQSGALLFAVWSVYDASGRATWYSLQPGSWQRDSSGALRFTGILYRTSGPYWGGAYDPSQIAVAAVGSASFIPGTAGRAQLEVAIDGAAASIALERMRF
jgi:hypothetical protein